ncbi:MAG: methionine adenosyltransferase [Candidatus Woesearchaeota archaeon]
MSYIVSSESVGAGHPDKLCDKISDAILDYCLSKDPESRVACETMAKDNKVILGGEITTKARLGPKNIEKIVRSTIKEIGYTNKAWGIDANTCDIEINLSKQSPNISQGVTEGEGDFKEQGAGDQGMMWGYACNETPELMPLSTVLAHKLVKRIAEVRESGEIPYLRPDCKSQVAVEYGDLDSVITLNSIVIAAQHDGDVEMAVLREDIKEKVIKEICGDYITDKTKFFINGTGRFEIGGPQGDCGLTGRKIIVDTYGGIGRHGGGAFSGKDPSKVDRSAAYAARYIAKNIVAAGLADECEVQLAYCIGVAEPTSILVKTGEYRLPDSAIQKIRGIFPTKPSDIISCLGLKNPKGWCYKDTAAYGHFGREGFPWEKTDKADELRKALK